MAYVAVSGGEEAIEASIALLNYYRSGTDKDLDLEVIEEKMSLLVDRVMSEAGLYAKRYAALALKQCEGSSDEARVPAARLSLHPQAQLRHARCQHAGHAHCPPHFRGVQGHPRRPGSRRDL